MKARLLRKLLNNTEYTIDNCKDYIAIGSNMVHDLISVNKETLKIKYALDAFGEGRKAIKHKELESIWDTLHELVKSGEIKSIIEGNDELENPLPVFTVEDGKLIETFTDKYGYPNTTIDGKLMHDNNYFKTKEEAIDYGIKESEAELKWRRERVEELGIEHNKAWEKTCKAQEKYQQLLALKESLTKKQTMNNYQERIMDFYLNSMGADVIYTPSEMLMVVKDCFTISRLEDRIWMLNCFAINSPAGEKEMKENQKKIEDILSKYHITQNQK